MKKIMFLCFTTLAILMLSGCNGSNEEVEIEITTTQYAEETTTEIVTEAEMESETEITYDIDDVEPIFETVSDELYIEQTEGIECEEFTEEEQEVYQDTNTSEYEFSSSEIWEMTRVVYLENGITYPECTYQTVYLTACVILNRLYDWDECFSIDSVIFQAGQYATAYMYSDYNGGELGSSNPDGWDISRSAVLEAIENTDRNPHFQAMFTQGDVYYIDPYTGECFCY